ncbi:MAG TPA: DivIVA domain-containing protein [Tissierellaceae bacterium]|nr:DivIVA domain-containing protein [Tissierellaceae bacterium]
MITPLDIQNKEFKKSLIGYKTKDVHKYLDYINKDYEDLYRENIELKDKIGILTDQIKQYNNLEETLKDTLIIAQTTADEVTSSSRKKAELIVEEAEMDARERINEAREQVKNIKIDYEYLKKEMFIFKSRYEAFIQGQLGTIKDFYNDFEAKDASKHIIEDELEDADALKDVDHLGA